jgi:hypothetical protein
MERDGLRLLLHSPPEVCNVAVQIINRLGVWKGRTLQEHRKRASERLNVIRHVAETIPYEISGARLAAKPREGCAQLHCACLRQEIHTGCGTLM